MGRGLGRSQMLLLRALFSLEAEGGQLVHIDEKGRRFDILHPVSRILNRAWQIAPEHRAEYERLDAERAAQEARARAGSEIDRELMALARAIRAYRSFQGRRREREFPDWFEVAVNPSRAFATLHRRGLIKRRATPGGGGACLTDAGREAASGAEVLGRRKGRGARPQAASGACFNRRFTDSLPLSFGHFENIEHDHPEGKK